MLGAGALGLSAWFGLCYRRLLPGLAFWAYRVLGVRVFNRVAARHPPTFGMRGRVALAGFML